MIKLFLLTEMKICVIKNQGSFSNDQGVLLLIKTLMLQFYRNVGSDYPLSLLWTASYWPYDVMKLKHYVWLIYPTNCMLAESVYLKTYYPFHIWSLQYPATLLVYYMNTKVAPINNVSSFCYYNLFDFRIVMTLQWWCVETKAKTLLTKSDKLAVTYPGHVRTVTK